MSHWSEERLDHTLRIFLSGSVPKGPHDARGPEYFWADAEASHLRAFLHDLPVVLLNPVDIDIPSSRSLDRYSADIALLSSCHLMLVDVRTKKGIGVGAEMMYARSRAIPVISLCPADSAYRTPEAVHAFVTGLSTSICESLEQVAAEIRRLNLSARRARRHTEIAA